MVIFLIVSILILFLLKVESCISVDNPWLNEGETLELSSNVLGPLSVRESDTEILLFIFYFNSLIN